MILSQLAFMMCIYYHLHTHWYPIMRTNIVIDDALMEKALKATGLRTKREAVEQGLKLLLKLKKQEQIKSFKGKLKWEGDLDSIRMDR